MVALFVTHLLCPWLLQEELARLERERLEEEARLQREAEEKRRLAEEAEREAERRKQEVDETKMVRRRDGEIARLC